MEIIPRYFLFSKHPLLAPLPCLYHSDSNEGEKCEHCKFEIRKREKDEKPILNMELSTF